MVVRVSARLAGQMVTKRRYALSNQSIKAATLLACWSKVPGLLPRDLMAQALGDKNKRSGDRITIDKVIARADSVANSSIIEIDGDEGQ